VENLESDNQLEVIVGRASGGSTKQLNVFEANGAVRSGWPARRDNEAGYGWGMYNENVTVGDLNDDGFKEIIGPTDTHYITALDRNGNQLAANAIYGAGKVWSQVGVHVDHAVDLRGYANCGTEHRPNFANSAPAIADVNGDGGREIIVVGDVYNCGIGDPDGDLYHLPWILKLDRTRWSGSGYDWTAIPAPNPNPGSGPLSQDYNVIENSVTNVVAADLDGDGFKEILYPSYDGRLHVYWLDKTAHGNWPYKVPGSGIRFAGEPVVADLDNDGKAEVIFTSWPQKGGNRLGQLHILDYHGNILHALDLPAPRSGTWNGALGAPTIANIDTDADMELVIGTVASGVVAYDLPNTANARILWGTGRGSFKRTGVSPVDDPFALSASPSAKAIEASNAANYTVNVQVSSSFSGTVTLNLVNPAPAELQVNLNPSTFTTSGQATLTVTDQHPSGPLIPGQAYNLALTATDGAITRTTTVSLLVGGVKTYLPIVIK
jgi:hypothetical protein